MNQAHTIQAVLFDYGVVLSGPPQAHVWQRMREITALDEPSFHAAYWAPRHEYDRGDYNGRDYWVRAAESAGLLLSPTMLEELIAADTDLWTGTNPPMVEWAGRLQAAGTPTGILSNIGDEMTTGVLARQPWLAGFAYALWSHTVRIAKPDPAIYAIAAQGLGLPPASILFIDDREDNIEGAVASGMEAILYTSQAEFEQTLHCRGLDELWRSGRLA